MAWIRQLPSKRWAATYRSPTGERITETWDLKSQAKRWADEEEASVKRGDWIDPRLAETTVSDCWHRFAGARVLERASRKRDESHWRVHVEPEWGRKPIGGILKPDISAWVNRMKTAHKDGCEDQRCRGCRVGAATIEGAVGVLRAILELAVDAKFIRTNPAVDVKTPRRSAHIDRILTFDEEDILLAAFEARFGDRPDGRLFVEFLLDTGARYEEAAAFERERVDMRKRLVHLGPVMEKDGRIRPYPKTPAGERPVPVGDELWPRFREHVLTVPPGGVVFTALEGGPLRYDNWRDRIWLKPLTVVTERGPRRKILKTRPLLDDPQPTPHDCRHTYGTRLGEAGVPPHEIAALMGHESIRSVERYLNAGEDRFERARLARSKARDSQVTHEQARRSREGR
jgi:integrase